MSQLIYTCTGAYSDYRPKNSVEIVVFQKWRS